ncbi:MAG: hypothetical protein Q9223_007600 [Gallowayella weberi]
MLYNDYYQIDKPTNPIHIVCKADVSLLTFDWVAEDRAPKPNFDAEHECMNWESIDGWAKDHAFDIFDETTLVHPTLGMTRRTEGSLLLIDHHLLIFAGPSFPEAEYKNKYQHASDGANVENHTT